VGRVPRGRPVAADAVEPLGERELDGISSYRSAARYSTHPVCVDCTGTVLGLNTALALADVSGQVLSFGLGVRDRVRTDLLVTKNLSLHGSIGGTGAFDEALGFLAAHGDAAVTLLSHRFLASAADEAFEATAEDPGRIKAQISFEGD
jgi:threonine dehydrogenase-like Zn-dependent dehydrogenase